MSLEDKGRVLIDPNTLSKDGTVALGGTSFNHQGTLMAYSLQTGGSDWQEWRVRDVATGKDLKDQIKWSKFSSANWTADGKGFYYSAYDAPKKGQQLSGTNYFQKVYYHRVGTPQSEDVLIHQDKKQKEWGFDCSETEDARYQVLQVWKGTNRENQVLIRDKRSKDKRFRPLFMGFDASYQFLGNDRDRLYFLTDKKAPNKRVVWVSAQGKPVLKDIVRETKESIESASIVGDMLFVNRLKDAATRVERFSLGGKSLGPVDLPGVGTATGFGGLRKHTETFYTFTSYNRPNTIFRYDLKTNRSSVWKTPKLPVDVSKYVVTRTFYKSFDGTRIPMFLTYRKGMKKNGQNPTLLYGYGGFAASMTPYFSTGMLGWLEEGGVLAVACIRGGAEYGNAWHDAGRLKNKMNVFKDFISAGEYLISSKITSTPKLAIQGASNGGLLIGAVTNLRPDLFAAALPEVGVMDMLRFHKFTIGWAWTSDYGSPDKKADFDVLRTYSPYHNIKEGTHYPAVMVTTGDHDDRVVPAHSFKYAAALQRAQGGDAPVLIRIETSAGHGAGKPRAKIIAELSDEYAFLAKNLGMKIR
jgi:prolyl oligopeptidase